jgi:4-amino-4-deoxy-L-arabinose transferase-like glycosyltransferase
MNKMRVIILGCILAVFLLTRLPYLSLPLERDEGSYAYEGWIWITGKGLPYRDAYEMKPPLLHLIYAVAIGLLGNNLYAIRIFAAFYMAIVVVLSALLMRRWWGEKTMLLGGITMALAMNSFRWGAIQFNAESLMLLPLLGVVWFIDKSLVDKKQRGWQIGLCLGLAIWIKQVAIYPDLILGAFYYWKMRSWKSLWQLATGAILPTIVFVTYFASRGALGNMWENIGYLASRSTSDGFNSLRLCGTTSIRGGCILGWLMRMREATFFFVLALVGFAVSFRKRERGWDIGALWVLAMWIVIKGAGWKDWNHYYLLLVPGLVWGVLLLWMWLGKKYKILVYYTAILLFLLTIGTEWAFILQGQNAALAAEYGESNQRLFSDAIPVANWLKSNMKEDEKLAVWNDEAEIYFYANKISASRWLYYYPPMLQTLKQYKNKLKNEDLTSFPEWVILTKYDLWGEKEWWKKNLPVGIYISVKQIGDYTIYKLNQK